MTIQLSVEVRNGRLNSLEDTIGGTAVLKLFTGTQPANTAAADSGTLLASMTLPADYMNAAASGSKTKLGTWQAASAAAGGTAGHFRMYASNGTSCHMQGTVTAPAGGGDLTVDPVLVVSGQPVTVNTWSMTDGNA